MRNVAYSYSYSYCYDRTEQHSENDSGSFSVWDVRLFQLQDMVQQLQDKFQLTSDQITSRNILEEYVHCIALPLFDVFYICIFISPEAGSQKQANEKTTSKNKYIVKEINTVPLWWHYALRGLS